MSWIPTEDTSKKSRAIQKRSGLELATVTSVPETGGHMIETEIQQPGEDGLDGSPIPTWVTISAKGDVSLPRTGDTVLIASTNSKFAVCLGVIYDRQGTVPTYTRRQRIVGHPFTDSKVLFDEDGTITIEANSGDKIEVDTSDGSVRINDGTNPVAYDVNTTKDPDGHVETVTLVTSDKLKVPS